MKTLTKVRKKAKGLPPLADTCLNALLFFGKGMIFFSKEGWVLDANPVAYEMLGYAKGGMARSSILDVNPYMSLLDWRKAWEVLLENGSYEENANFFNCKEELIPMNTFTALTERKGEPCALVFFEPLYLGQNLEKTQN